MTVYQFTWENAELLEQNRQRALRELRTVLRNYEARYELNSDQVETELQAGRLRETAEVCDWVIAIRSYRALQDA